MKESESGGCFVEWAMTKMNGLFPCYRPIYSSVTGTNICSIICYLLLFIQCVLPPLLYYYLESVHPLCSPAELPRMRVWCTHPCYSIASPLSHRHARDHTPINDYMYVCVRVSVQAITMQPIYIIRFWICIHNAHTYTLYSFDHLMYGAKQKWFLVFYDDYKIVKHSRCT